MGLNRFDFRLISSDVEFSLDLSERLVRLEFARTERTNKEEQKSCLLDAIKLALEHGMQAERRIIQLNNAVEELRNLTRESSELVRDSASAYELLKAQVNKAKNDRGNAKRKFKQIENLQEQIKEKNETIQELKLTVESLKNTLYQDKGKIIQENQEQTIRSISMPSRSLPPSSLPERLYLARLESDRAASAYQAEEDMRRSRVAKAKEEIQKEKSARELEKQRIRQERRRIINKIKEIEGERRKIMEQNKRKNYEKISQQQDWRGNEEVSASSEESEVDSIDDKPLDDSPVTRALKESRATRNVNPKPPHDEDVLRKSNSQQNDSSGFDQFKLEINGTATIEPSQTKKKTKETVKQSTNQVHHHPLATDHVASVGSIAPLGTFTMYRIAKAKRGEQKQAESKHDDFSD
jgi:hypothetical protein